MHKKVFITGATGVLGKQLLKLFLFKEDVELILLIRDKNSRNYKYKIFVEDISKGKKILAKVRFVSGDITKSFLGLNKQIYFQLCASINEIYHCAALTDFKQPFRRVQLINVNGTKNVLLFAKRCFVLRKLNYISTAFIVGDGYGRFKEKDLNIEQNFNNPYEKSKFEAEILVRKCLNKNFIIAIFRPSIIVGEYFTSKTTAFQMFYQYFHTLSLNLIKILPINPKSLVNLIPCDLAAKAIFLLSQNLNKNDTYHIVTPTNLSILNLTKFASRYIGFDKPKYINIEEYKMNNFSLYERKLINVYLPFLNFKAIFDAKKTINELKVFDFIYPKMDYEFVSRLFDYAIRRKFIIKNKTYVKV